MILQKVVLGIERLILYIHKLDIQPKCFISNYVTFPYQKDLLRSCFLAILKFLSASL